MLPSQLLWDPLPDPPRARRAGWFGWLANLLPGAAAMGVEELVECRVRRGAAQALVRQAHLAAVAAQDSAHRPSVAFAEAWRAHLAT